MKTKIRWAAAGDEKSMVKVKFQLQLDVTMGDSLMGGFLLGSDEASYRQFVDHGLCAVADRGCDAGADVIGFGIVLPDALIRSSPMWEKRHDIEWLVDISIHEKEQLCYFEQLAFVQGHRRMANLCAFELTRAAFETGNDTLFTTTVKKPIRNLAAVPMIESVGGTKVGEVEEGHPVLGSYTSDIYRIRKNDFFNSLRTHRLGRYLNRPRLGSLTCAVK